MCIFHNYLFLYHFVVIIFTICYNSLQEGCKMSLSLLKEHISVKNIFVFVLILGALVLMSKITNVLMLFFASYVVACSFNPIVAKMEKKMPRSIAVGLLLLGIVLALFVFFIPVIVLSVQQIQILFLFCHASFVICLRLLKEVHHASDIRFCIYYNQQYQIPLLFCHMYFPCISFV